MAELVLMRGPENTLLACDGFTADVIKGWPLGQGVRANVKKARDIVKHRKFFALVEVVTHYSEVYDTRAKALDAIKLVAGHVDWMLSPVTGDMVPIPKSISFASMDDDTFKVFYNDAVNGVLKHILPMMGDRETLDQAVDIVVRF
jgi:hypothetical protein